jgi:hypothetical protein
MIRFALILSAAAVWLTVSGSMATAEEPASKKGDRGFIPIFDGKTLNGWHVNRKTGHGTGGRWIVENGAIVGSQDRPGNGGLIMTDAPYGNVEVVLEMNNDFGPDSGLFLRCSPQGKAYQALIDYHPDGNLMGVYGEGFSPPFQDLNFRFLDKPTAITPEKSNFPLPIEPDKWPDFWKPGRWQTLRARITGNPPTIDTWIGGVHFMHWTGTKKELPDRGGIALQVHGGNYPPGFDLTKLFVRYRNIRVKVLD